MAKALGSEIVEFYLNGWPKGYFVDDSELTVTDDRRIMPGDCSEKDRSAGFPLSDRFELSKFGVIISEEDSSQIYDFAYFFNRWRKDRDIVTLVAEMPKAMEEKFRKLAATVTGMVVR
jgi:hypothetical protein